MNLDLLNKYNVAVPRYTSYPPANFFDIQFDASSYVSLVEASNRKDPQHISIYIHIPFCHRLCYYCGCNAMIMQKQTIVETYLSALEKELISTLSLLHKNRKISQIHYGGGSPTSLSIDQLKRINQLILSRLVTIENPEIAIECHPGGLELEYWQQMSDAGFTRVSIGIQDFNLQVLQAVNRKPSLLPVEKIVEVLRAQNIAINMDFIYGLPHQTEQSFSETMDQAIALSPDRIVTFSYAHVPWVNPLQMKLEEVGLPTTEVKNKLYASARTKLCNAGYQTIGLDHFVLPTDELYTAQQSKQLHRNFQGYCTRRTTGQVYAFGTTGISQLTGAYMQNTKDIHDYIRKINEAKSPIIKGYVLNDKQQLTALVIEELMCNYTIDWQTLAQEANVSVEILRDATNYNKLVLDEFVKDGIIAYDEDTLTILPGHTQFVRNVAASLDPLLIDTDKRFSKSV